MTTQIQEQEQVAGQPTTTTPPCQPPGNDHDCEAHSPSPRRYRDAPRQYSIVEKACIVAAYPGFWAVAENMPRNQDIVGLRGRKPKAPDFTKLLIVCVRTQTISMLAAITALSYGPVWTVIREVLEQNRPPEWDPVPLECPGLSQMKSFNQKLARLDAEWHEECPRTVTSEAIRDAKALGYLSPSRTASLSNPDSRDFVATDGTVLKPAFGSGPDDSLGPQIVFNDEAATNKPLGTKLLTTSVRGDAPGSRIILSADVVPPGPNGSPGGESEPIARAVRSIAQASDGGVMGVIVDSVIRGTKVAELDREGIITVNHPHAQSNPNRAEGGRKAEGRIERTLELPPMRHETASGAQCEHDLVLVGSVPHTRRTDDEGNEQLVPLRIVKPFRRKNKKGTYRSYHEIEVSCIHGNFKHTHRLFPEDETGINYGEFARVYPTDSQNFAELYGHRNATESWHAELKRNLRRPPVRGMQMQTLYFACMTLTHNAITMERMREAEEPPSANAA